MTKHTVRLVAATVLAALSGPALADSTTLTESQFRDEIVGRELQASRGLITIRAIHRADGTSSMRSSFRNSEGAWRFADGRVCVRWERLREGKERCSAL
ncbi:MAG: hypothetical protein AAFR60_00150, partial [Pseudomonadota bacterium]